MQFGRVIYLFIRYCLIIVSSTLET